MNAGSSGNCLSPKLGSFEAAAPPSPAGEGWGEVESDFPLFPYSPLRTPHLEGGKFTLSPTLSIPFPITSFFAPIVY
jgi:hypothetical protein